MKPLLAIMALFLSLALAPVRAQELGNRQPVVIGIVATDAGGVVYYSDGSEISIAVPVEATQGTLTADWYSGGIHIVVCEPKEPGESFDNQLDRFARNVEKTRKKYPPDVKNPPTTGGRI